MLIQYADAPEYVLKLAFAGLLTFPDRSVLATAPRQALRHAAAGGLDELSFIAAVRWLAQRHADAAEQGSIIMREMGGFDRLATQFTEYAARLEEAAAADYAARTLESF